MAAELRIPALYRERFGVRVGVLDTVTAAEVVDVLARCAAQDVRLLIARCPTTDAAAVHALEAAGCRLMDTLLYFRRDLTADVPPMPAMAAPVALRAARPEDADRVEAIAAEAFTGYGGHFHADPRLERAACDAVYTSWARASVLSRDVADEVLVAEVAGGEVAGFLTLKFATLEIGEGPLYGVAAEHQGQGLGGALMALGLRWLQARGATWMQMSTQVTNTRSQRVWLRLGFEPSHSSYTFHRWFD